MTKDFDAARRARLEKLGEPQEFTFGGRTFNLPPELPYVFAEHLVGGDMRAALEVVLGNDAKALFEAKPSIQDVAEIVNWIAETAVGITPGESEGSPSTSRGTGKSQKRRSSGSTGST